MQIPPNFDYKSNEFYFGFQMTTSSLKFQEDPFTITVPVLINCGVPKIKGDDGKSQQSSRTKVT